MLEGTKEASLACPSRHDGGLVRHPIAKVASGPWRSHRSWEVLGQARLVVLSCHYRVTAGSSNQAVVGVKHSNQSYSSRGRGVARKRRQITGLPI